MLNLATPVYLCLVLCVLCSPNVKSHSGGSDETQYDGEYDDYDNETEENYDYDEDYEYDPFGCEAKDLCKGANRSKESLLSPSDMSAVEHWRTACFCDANCWRYGDCCVDASVQEDGSKKIDWRCDLLPGYGEYIYVIGSCPPDWKNRHDVAICERRIFDQGYNFLLDVPVFSKSSKRAFSNVFCAKCNREVDLSPIRLNLLCPFHLPNCSYQLHRGTYIPGQLTWNINTNVTLTLRVDYLADWENLKMSYNPRRCWPIIDTCPKSHDLYSCNKNTSYVRTFFPLGSVKFKNIDCALCNDVSPTEIECVSDPHPDYTSTPILPHLPIQPEVGLFYSWDMEFHDSPQEGTGTGWKFRCLNGDFYHPVYKVCVPFVCGNNFVKIREQCVRLRANDTTHLKPTGCKMLAVDNDEVTLLQADVIYVNKTKTTYRRGEFEELDKFTFLVCNDRNMTLTLPPVVEVKTNVEVKTTPSSCSSKVMSATYTFNILAFAIVCHTLFIKI